MTTFRKVTAGFGGIMVAVAFMGCGEGGEAVPKGGEPVKISPGMEKMKDEMIKAFQKNAKGKSPLKSEPAKQ